MGIYTAYHSVPDMRKCLETSRAFGDRVSTLETSCAHIYIAPPPFPWSASSTSCIFRAMSPESSTPCITKVLQHGLCLVPCKYLLFLASGGSYHVHLIFSCRCRHLHNVLCPGQYVPMGARPCLHALLLTHPEHGSYSAVCLEITIHSPLRPQTKPLASHVKK